MIARIPNPRYAGAPAFMSDGRLFTDYRANCNLLGLTPTGPSFVLKQRVQQTGQYMAAADRSTTVLRAGSTGCVDTMVPELTKRVCGWDGCTTLPGHAVGIGQGRLYLPGSHGLASADPDRLAAATAFNFGTFPAFGSAGMYEPTEVYVRAQSSPVVPAAPNRYSAPYGN
jgi:hypothetical protein